MNRRSVVALLGVTGLVASLIGAQFVRNNEARNRPRVLYANGVVVSSGGGSSLPVESQAMTVFERLGGSPLPPITWDAAPVAVSLVRDQLTIRRGDRQADSVDLRGLDYVTEVLATTATLDAGREWLAVLVRLRSTGHRVHKELLERTRWQKPALAAAGERGQRQEFVINPGQPQRFTAAK